MSDSKPDSSCNPPAPTVVSLPKLNVVAVMAALGSPVRWPVIQLLADGREMNINDGAAMCGCTAVNFSKHLSVMLKAGVVECRQGTDRRNTIYFIPAARRQVPGVIDYGVCKVDLRAE